MTRHELATLACKILGLCWFAQALPLCVGMAVMVCMAIYSVLTGGGNQSDDLARATAASVPTIGILLVAGWLWIWAPSIAKRMVSDREEAVTLPRIDQQALLTVLLIAVGVSAALPALRHFAQCVFRISRDSHPTGGLMSDAGLQQDFWTSILEMALAAWIMFGSRGIARVTLMVRNAGIATDSEPENREPSGDETAR